MKTESFCLIKAIRKIVVTFIRLSMNLYNNFFREKEFEDCLSSALMLRKSNWMMYTFSRINRIINKGIEKLHNNARSHNILSELSEHRWKIFINH